jgi:predicted RNA-binding protein with PUA-like domain
VDVAAVADLPKPVTLADVKANPKLKDMVLARVPRLSVQPVSSQEWSMICLLGGLPNPPQA